MNAHYSLMLLKKKRKKVGLKLVHELTNLHVHPSTCCLVISVRAIS